MSDKNIQMTQRNATNDGWDNLNPKTKAANVIAADGSTVESHLADNLYQTATGTGTAIALIIKGTLTNGYPIAFIASANNGGAVTTINGKHLYKPNTTATPTLIAGKAYIVWYNSTSDCFFIKASAEGDAVVGDVLAGKKFSNDNDTGLTGAMVEQGSPTFTPTNVDQNIVAGHYTGGIVKAVPMVAGTDLIYTDAVQQQTLSTSYVKTREVQINSTGTVRISFSLGSGETGVNAYGRIYKNNVAVGTERIKAGGSSIYTEDISVIANDKIEIYQHSIDGSAFAYTSNFTVGITISNPTATKLL